MKWLQKSSVKSCWILLLILALLPASPALAAHAEPPVPISPAGAVSLVRIDLHSPLEFNRLAGKGLKFYTQMSGERGQTALFLPASADQQTRLAWMGYTVQVLDPDIQGARYYLLSGLTDDLLSGQPEDFSQAGDDLRLLMVSGRQGLARATPQQAERLGQMGIRSLLLAAQPVSAAAAQAEQADLTRLEASPIVVGMLDQVTAPVLVSALEELTGEHAIRVDGSPYTLTSRYSLSPIPIQKATQYAYDTFQGLGLKTSFDPYILLQQAQVRNVIAEQTGLTQPKRIFLLTAHIDSTSNINPYQYAPGADDNASGTAAVMQAARILSQYDFGCTLRYALFTGEEQGLWGAAAYASDLLQLGENVEGVLNLDMLGYNTPDSEPVMELHVRQGHLDDLAIANQFVEVVQTYSLNLNPLLLADSMHSSDHAAFWDRGIPATIAIEDWTDHTPYYHRTEDKIATLNMDYYTAMVKAAVGTLGQMGCLLDGQASGVVHSAAGGLPLPGVQVEAWQEGQPVRKVITGSDGSYRLPLQAGMYKLRFSAAGYQATSLDGATIFQGQETQHSPTLETCTTVEAPAFQFTPSNPRPGVGILFQARVGGGQEPVSYSWTLGDTENAQGSQVSHIYALPGVYTVTLTTDNACGYPQTVSRNLYVGPNVLYLPVIRK